MSNSFGKNKEILDILNKAKISKTSEEEKPDLQPKKVESLKPAPEKRENAVVRLNDIQISESGQLTKTKYFEMLEIDKDNYPDISLTPEEAKKVALSIRAMSSGLTASVPLTCTGEKCSFRNTCPYFEVNQAPLGRPCHLPGELISTISHGEIKIENLDPKIHSLVSYERKWNAIRKNNKNGYSFKLSKKYYDGMSFTFNTISNKSYKCTHDHIAIARFNELALSKFCVYIMQKGDFWRIGKSRILDRYEKSEYGHKTYLPIQNRFSKEKADKLWILGIFDSNTEALLAEEFYSIQWQTTKTCFVDSLERIDNKYDGLYKWVTQEQLNNHHKSLLKPPCFYALKLNELGLSYDYPFIMSEEIHKTGNYIEKPRCSYGMYIRACNIIPEIMDMPVIPDNIDLGYRNKVLAKWEKITVDYAPYTGIVYGLDVDNHKTYFAGKIATHNCPIEKQLISYWTSQYVEEFQVNFNSLTEVRMVSELAEFDIYEMRITKYLAENHPTLLQEVISFNAEGREISNLEISRAFELKERIKRNRMKVLEALVATRKDKVKMMTGAVKGGSTAERIDDLKKKIEGLNQDIKKMDYIDASVVTVK